MPLIGTIVTSLLTISIVVKNCWPDGRCGPCQDAQRSLQKRYNAPDSTGTSKSWQWCMILIIIHPVHRRWGVVWEGKGLKGPNVLRATVGIYIQRYFRSVIVQWRVYDTCSPRFYLCVEIVGEKREFCRVSEIKFAKIRWKTPGRGIAGVWNEITT